MKSKRHTCVIWLLLWIMLAGSLWMINVTLPLVPISLIYILFCLAGCIQTIWFLYVFLNVNHTSDTIINKKSSYETLINNTEDTIILLDTKGYILFINTTGANRFGFEPDVLVGKNAFDLLTSNIRTSRYNKFQYVMAHKKSVRFIDERNKIHFDQILSPVLDCFGNVIGVAIYGRDITELIKIEKQLKNARQDAESANAAKSIFLTHVSHELRTPLNVILGYTQILQAVTTLKNEEQKSLSKIHKNVEFIISLIDDILDLSRIETQNMSLSIDVFEFNEFLGYISDIAMMYKQEKGIDFKYHFDNELPTYVKGDERRLKQVLLNLLVNAFKYTQKGHVFLQVLRQEELILFRVEDTGIGINEESISEIFEPFHRLACQSEGFGLGLSIARHLVEMMGGKLQVESVVEKGSTFWFSLFLEPVNTKKSTIRPIPISLNISQEFRKKILIVDDLKDNRVILQAMLSPLGFEISEAKTGESALKCIENGFIPDLVLIDLIMPVMDGFEFVNQLKKNYPELKTKIIAVSASNQLLSDKSVLFDARLAKPVQKRQLFDEIGKQLKIQSLYQDLSTSPERKASNTIKAKTPEKQICERLIDFARHGHITDIKDEIRNLEKHSQFQAFINQIEIFVIELDFDGLIDYLQKIDN